MRERFLPAFCLGLYVLAVTVGAFTGGLWATLGLSGAIVFFIGAWIHDRKMPMPPRRLALLAVVALACFAAELPFSSRPELSLHVWGQLVSIFVPLLWLTSPRIQALIFSPRWTPALAVATGIGALALGFELASGGYLLHLYKRPDAGLTEYNRGIAHLVILAFPLFAALWGTGRKIPALALALLLLFPASLTESHTAQLALMIGALCTAAAFYRPVWAQRALALFTAMLVSFPFYIQQLFTTHYDAVETWHASWRHRIEIWDYLSYRIMERPLLGWGLGTTHTLDFVHPHGDMYRMAVVAAPHAHNFIIELWVETGLIGLAFGFIFLFYALGRVLALPASLRPFALGCWAAAVIVAMFGFDFWTDALWAAFALSACAFGMLEQRIERGQNLADTEVGDNIVL